MAGADELMAEAGETVRGAQQSLTRESAEYDLQNDAFRIRERSFSSQYFDIYKARIARFRPVLQEAAAAQWASVEVEAGSQVAPKHVDHILDLQAGRLSVAIGTVYKHHPLMPTVLQIYAKSRAITAPPPVASYVGEEDVAYLEDEGGRVRLHAATGAELIACDVAGRTLEATKLLHGQVVAVLGVAQENGTLLAQRYLTVGPAPQKALATVEDDEEMADSSAGPLEGASRLLALVSGLQGAGDLSLDLLLAFLEGNSGSGMEQEQVLRKIVRVVVAGNTMPRLQKGKEEDDMAFQRRRGDMGATEQQVEHAAVVRHADLMMASLSSCLPVDLMPGINDPANFSMPQQPFNHCLFPAATRYATFHRVTNPHKCSIGDTTVLGTSGQEIDSMHKFLKLDGNLELLQELLTSRHLAPTAPDTLATYPCKGADPFVMDECPHVYFVGNQDKFETCLYKGTEGQRTRIVCIPKFSTTATLVLVDLDTLACHPVVFQVPAS